MIYRVGVVKVDWERYSVRGVINVNTYKASYASVIICIVMTARYAPLGDHFG